MASHVSWKLAYNGHEQGQRLSIKLYPVSWAELCVEAGAQLGVPQTASDTREVLQTYFLMHSSIGCSISAIFANSSSKLTMMSSVVRQCRVNFITFLSS